MADLRVRIFYTGASEPLYFTHRQMNLAEELVASGFSRLLGESGDGETETISQNLIAKLMVWLDMDSSMSIVIARIPILAIMEANQAWPGGSCRRC